MMNTGAIVGGLLLIGTLVIWFGVDILLIAKGGIPNSISWAAAKYAEKYPIIPAVICLILGLILGHLYWPNTEYCDPNPTTRLSP